MLFKKIFLSVALVFMSSLVACGDDSSSNAGDSSDSKDNTITSSNSEETNSSESKNEEYNTEKTSETNDNCIDKSQCDAMVKSDISTWHFTRADAFGEPTTYTYSVDGSKLILDIDGKVNENSYSFYDMTKEAHQEMAFLAVRSTCEDGMEIEGANYCD